jgi:hypothetical protein
MQAQDEERAPVPLLRPAIFLALAGAAVLAQWPLFDRTIVPMDEGHLAAVADWLLDGRRLYADVHTGLFPGVYLAAAGLFALFGRDLLVTRIAAAGLNVAIVLAAWAAARRVVSPGLALLPPLAHLAWVVVAFPVLSMFNYSLLALALGLVALVLLLRLLERGGTADAVALGMTAAAAVATKQNFGALIVVALGIGLLWCRAESALAGRSLWRTAAPISAGGAVVIGAVAGFLIGQGIVAAWLDSTVLSLLGSQLRDFDNPIPPLLGAHPRDVRFVFLYTPPALFNALIHGEPIAGVPITDAVRSAAIRLSYGAPIVVLAGSLVVLARTRTTPAGPRRNATRVVIVFAELFFLGLFPSAIWSHLAFVAPPVFLLAAIGHDSGPGRSGRAPCGGRDGGSARQRRSSCWSRASTCRERSSAGAPMPSRPSARACGCRRASWASTAARSTSSRAARRPTSPSWPCPTSRSSGSSRIGRTPRPTTSRFPATWTEG